MGDTRNIRQLEIRKWTVILGQRCNINCSSPCLTCYTPFKGEPDNRQFYLSSFIFFMQKYIKPALRNFDTCIKHANFNLNSNEVFECSTDQVGLRKVVARPKHGSRL